MRRAIFWFRNDLRVDDNHALVKAASDNVEVLPVYVLENCWFEEKQWGIDRIGPFRLKFLLESLQDLKKQLQSIGSDLMILQGEPVTELTQLAQEYQCDKIYAQSASAYNEVQTEQKLASSIPCDFTWNQTLYHIQDLNFSLHELPEVFTQFRKAVEKKSDVRTCAYTPLSLNSPKDFGSKVPSMDDFGYHVPISDNRAVLPFEGGTSAGLNRLAYYLWDTELLSNYKYTRNGLIGGDYSSKFSAWLALGCISPRQIYWEVKKYEKYVKKNSSTYWLIFELIWRDYFHFVAKKYSKLLFLKSGLTGQVIQHKHNNKLLHLWTEGRTKEPLIDANMNELNATGFMSNRGRQIVASYLIHTMGIDWRLGAAYFEKMLIDYDPCSNYGNWAYIAGVGNDPRGGRDFNIVQQQDTYDPKGDYRELWSH